MSSATLRGGTFNLLYGRDPARVVEEVWTFLDAGQLGFVCTQETADYVDALRASRLRVIGSGETCIVVHPRVKVRARRRFSYGDGWTTIRGGHHPPVVMWQALLDDWLTVRSVHLPTPSDWQGGRLDAPPERADDLRAASRGLVRYLRQGGARIAAGDYNEPPETRGVFSPHWIASETGSAIDAPVKGSGHGRIDYVLSRGCEVNGVRVVRGSGERSDHDPVRFRVARRFVR